MRCKHCNRKIPKKVWQTKVPRSDGSVEWYHMGCMVKELNYMQGGSQDVKGRRV